MTVGTMSVDLKSVDSERTRILFIHFCASRKKKRNNKKNSNRQREGEGEGEVESR